MIDFPRLFSVRNEFARQKHILTVTRKFGEVLFTFILAVLGQDAPG